MRASRWFRVALCGASVLSLLAAMPASAAEKKKTAAKAKAKPVVVAVPQDPRGRAVHACKEHVDRVMRSPTGTTHGEQVRVDDKGGESFLVAGTVAGLREGSQVQAEWECDVTKVGSGLMHTKTKLFLPR